MNWPDAGSVSDCSKRARPTPQMTPPIAWLRAVLGLRIRGIIGTDETIQAYKSKVGVNAYFSKNCREAEDCHWTVHILNRVVVSIPNEAESVMFRLVFASAALVGRWLD
jgi:hypothetical protein